MSTIQPPPGPAERAAERIEKENAVYGDCLDCDEAVMCVHAKAAVAVIIATEFAELEQVLRDLIADMDADLECRYVSNDNCAENNAKECPYHRAVALVGEKE